MRARALSCLAILVLLAARAASARADTYVTYPGDTLRIRTLSSDDLDITAIAPQDGVVTCPLIGALPVTRRPLDEIEKEVAERLNAEYLVNPSVSVSVVAYARRQVYLLGSVKNPTVYDLPSAGSLTLLQVVSMAGGYTPDAARDQVRIFRQKAAGGNDRVVLVVNTLEVTEQSQAQKDPVLQPGDMVLVPTLKKIFVMGNVNAQGAYDIPSDRRLTVTQAISMAGGFNKIARESKVRILRPGADGKNSMIVVDVGEILSDGKLDRDVPLQPGDIVFVPESIF